MQRLVWSTRPTSQFRVSSMTTSPSGSPMAINRSTPRSTDHGVSHLKSKFELGRCTRPANLELLRTGLTRKKGTARSLATTTLSARWLFCVSSCLNGSGMPVTQVNSSARSQPTCLQAKSLCLRLAGMSSTCQLAQHQSTLRTVSTQVLASTWQSPVLMARRFRFLISLIMVISAKLSVGPMQHQV